MTSFQYETNKIVKAHREYGEKQSQPVAPVAPHAANTNYPEEGIPEYAQNFLETLDNQPAIPSGKTWGDVFYETPEDIANDILTEIEAKEIGENVYSEVQKAYS
ncbi:MAG: hypothetical protein KJ906_03125 [Nanoarchaeota archaeon]|nr:hypothetical protein [Nanoarchaeota archaeon]